VAVVAPGSYSVARPAERTARGRDRIADLVLRPALAVAAAHQREHQRPAAPVLPQAHQPVRAERTRPECRRCRTQPAAPHRARRPGPRTRHEVIDAALPCAPREFTSPKGALAEQVEPSRLVHLAYRDRLSIRCSPISSFSCSPTSTTSGTSAGTRRSDRGGSRVSRSARGDARRPVTASPPAAWPCGTLARRWRRRCHYDRTGRRRARP
jgi:hypothetical protein